MAQELSAPPRQIPTSLWIRVLLGGKFVVFGWGLLIIGGFLATVFVGNSEVASWYRFRGKLLKTDARVVGASKSSLTLNGQHVERTTFEYEVAGVHHVGASYGEGAGPEVGASVGIEYSAESPQYARVVGMRASPAPSYVAAVLLFPLVGLIFVLNALRKGRRHVHLMEHGRTAFGRLTHKQSTASRVNNRRVYELTFEFDDAGDRKTTVLRSHRQELLDDRAEQELLHDRTRETSCLVSQLPGHPFAERGQWQPISMPRVMVVLILPVLAVVSLIWANSVEL